MITEYLDPATLENSWTAEVMLDNGQILTIWHTAWKSIKHLVKEVLSISSDFPQCRINTITNTFKL